MNYTYFKGSSKTYIDHCIVTRHAEKLITDCKILCSLSDNVSDHFPISMTLSVPRYNSDIICEERNKSAIHINWNDSDIRNSYIANLSNLLHDVYPPKDINSIKTTEQAQEFVSTYCDAISRIMNQASDLAVKAVKKPQQKKRSPKHWWNHDCKISKDRNRFWYNIWHSCGRPREGAVYESYKYAKHVFRKTCRKAVNQSITFNFSQCNILYKQHRMKLFWNRIKKSQETGDTNYNNISLVELENHFKNKFSYDSENENSFIANAREQVEMKLSECQNVYNDFVFTVTNLRRFIKNLKNGCAPGGDSITSGHVKLASNTDVVLHLCNLFTLCFKFGVVPDSFNNGILVPLLKKSTLDPSVAKNYRLVVLSTVFSKIIEMYILTQCADYKYN